MPQQIGASHPRIKQARNLIRNAAPNHDQLFVAEGLWAHRVLLDAGVAIRTFFWSPESAYSPEAIACSDEVRLVAHSTYRISAKTLTRITDRDRPDGLVSIAEQPVWQPEALVLGDEALVVVADGVEIPGNLGSLLRTLDACAADALVLTNRRTRMTHPKVLRGSRGMSLTVPSVEFGTPEDAIAWLERLDFNVYLADTDEAEVYSNVDFSGRTAIVVGNERYGVSRPWFDREFARVCVPMLGAADSLNVATSAAVLLYAARAAKGGW